MKLNLGCGSRQLEGWLNIDTVPQCRPDRVMDLERTPWDLPSDSADEVLLNHVLEHLGADTATFLAVMCELHRVCADQARIRINVPHPLHLNFRTDPSHVRRITPQTLSMFSRRCCQEAAAAGSPMTPFATILGIDFELAEAEYIADAATRRKLERKGWLGPDDQLTDWAEIIPNLVEEIRIVLIARKTPPSAGPTVAAGG
jgi:hypothetical protein